MNLVWQWLFAFLGFPISGLVAYTVIGKMDSGLKGIIAGLVIGFILGLIQHFIIKNYIHISFAWILLSTIGMAIGLGIAVTIHGSDVSSVALIARGLLSGLFKGILQTIFFLKNLTIVGFCYLYLHIQWLAYFIFY